MNEFNKHNAVPFHGVTGKSVAIRFGLNPNLDCPTYVCHRVDNKDGGQ
jgi:hypothetical protein